MAKEPGEVTREEFEDLKQRVNAHAKMSGYADQVNKECKKTKGKGGEESTPSNSN